MSYGCVNPAVILDIEGDLIQHPNGPTWLRITVSRETARDLYESLRTYVEYES